MIKITEEISISESEISEEFIRSSGPGGQNVNKVATAVQLRFKVKNNKSLPEKTRERLMKIAKKNINKDGFLIITAKRFRSQEKNRVDAIERLKKLIQRASQKIKIRKSTKIPKVSRLKRLGDKKNQALKKSRRSPPDKTEI